MLRCWVTSDGITITRPGRSHPIAIADVPIGALTADDYNQALEHVRQERAYRTYTEVHGLVVQILKWAVANRYLRPTDLGAVHQMPLAVPQGDEESARGMARAVPDEEIPSPEMIDALAATAEELFGARTRALIYLFSYTGMRISEALALRNDDRFVYDEIRDVWRIHIREQVQRGERRTFLPKWRKKRWTFVPVWLSRDVRNILEQTASGAPLFPSPGRKVRRDDGTVERVGRGLYPYNNWRSRVWNRLAEQTPGWPERDSWWPPGDGPASAGTQSGRRWRWSAHSLRHSAATYQLNVLGLDPDDVASFLGHRSGRQVWEMYVRVRPNFYGRAAQASRSAGDPRRCNA